VENRVRGLDAGLDELVAVASSAPADVLDRPGELLQYLLDHMLAGHEQDDDVTVLVVHVSASGSITGAGTGPGLGSEVALGGAGAPASGQDGAPEARL